MSSPSLPITGAGRRPAKFCAGRSLDSVEEVAELFHQHLATGRDVFVWRDDIHWRTCFDGSRELRGTAKPVHIAVAYNMPLSFLWRLIADGRLRRAEVSQAYKEWLSAESAEVFRPIAMIGRAA